MIKAYIKRLLYNNIKEKDKESDKSRTIHHVSIEELNNFYLNYSPVFVLSTGRSGTGLINEIFSISRSYDSYHEAFPNLMMLTNYSYWNQEKSEVLKKIFSAARIERILSSYLNDRIYVESNHCLTFYCYQILEIFPNAKFIHLVRHPGNFVRSAIMKGWYMNDTIWESYRLRMKEKRKWELLSQMEKLAWNWNETQIYIEKFKKRNRERLLTIKLEDLITNPNTSINIISFIMNSKNIQITEIENVINHKVNEMTMSPNDPPNLYKINNYPKYIKWSNKDKNILKKYCNKTVKLYNYNL